MEGVEALSLLRMLTDRAYGGSDLAAMPEHYKLNLFGREHLAYTQTLEAPKSIVRPKFRHLAAKGNSTSVHRRNPLGSLDLPTEILRMIILQLDLISLRAFGNSNTHFLRVIRNTPEFHNLVEGAPEFCYLLVKTQLARWFALHRIYHVLTSSACAVCRRFARNVFLPGMQRCCPRCLQLDPEFQPITPAVAQRQYGVPKKSLNELPMLETLPGRYSNNQGSVQTFTKIRSLTSRMEARRLGSQKGKDLRWGKDLKLKPDHLYYTLERNMCTIQLGVLDVKGSRTDYGLHCKGCASVCEDHGRCSFASPGRRPCGQYSLPMGIDVEANDQSPPPQHAIRYCAIKTSASRLYTKQTLLEHIQDCQSAKVLILEGMLLSQTRVLMRPIWPLILILLPRLFWSIESYLYEDTPGGIMDLPQANKCNREADKLEEAVWRMYRGLLRASKRTFSSVLYGRTLTLDDVVRDSMQAFGVLGELQSLNRQAMECQAENLSEADPQNLPALAAVREKFATMVTRLGGLVEGLCPRSREDLVNGSNALEDDAKPHVGGKYNLRSRR